VEGEQLLLLLGLVHMLLWLRRGCCLTCWERDLGKVADRWRAESLGLLNLGGKEVEVLRDEIDALGPI
jgi:hypothetical protein